MAKHRGSPTASVGLSAKRLIHSTTSRSRPRKLVLEAPTYSEDLKPSPPGYDRGFSLISEPPWPYLHGIYADLGYHNATLLVPPMGSSSLTKSHRAKDTSFRQSQPSGAGFSVGKKKQL